LSCWRSSPCGPVTFPRGAITFADAVVDDQPVITADTRPVENVRDPQQALGPPNDGAGSHVLEGQAVTLGSGGQRTLQVLDNVLTGDGTAAPDLWIAEVGDNLEDTRVEVSADGLEWKYLGTIRHRGCGIDLDGFGFDSEARFTVVRLTDDSDSADSTPGADIDAVGAISTKPVAALPDANVELQVTVAAEATSLAAPSPTPLPTLPCCDPTPVIPTPTTTPHGASDLGIDAVAPEELVDLAWLAPGPADLDEDGYGLTFGVYQPVATGGVSVAGNPGPLTSYDEAFSRNANQTYFQMTIPMSRRERLRLRLASLPMVTARRPRSQALSTFLLPRITIRTRRRRRSATRPAPSAVSSRQTMGASTRNC
jgi:hypothetical protein